MNWVRLAAAVSAAGVLSTCTDWIGPLPLLISQGIFLKLHRMVIALLAASWLVKLVIIAVAIGKYVH